MGIFWEDDETFYKVSRCIIVLAGGPLINAITTFCLNPLCFLLSTFNNPLQSFKSWLLISLHFKDVIACLHNGVCLEWKAVLHAEHRMVDCTVS